MKTLLTTLMLLGSFALFGQFSGYYDPANWTQTNSSPCDDGYVDASGAPASIAIWSSDDPTCSRSSQVTRYMIPMEACGTISFNWDYTTYDCNGSVWDQFGYMVNGTPTQLSINGFPYGTSQSGSASVAVNVGDVFAFYMDAIDNFCGRATSMISGFSGPSCDLVLTVEEPDTIYFGYDETNCTNITATASSSNGPITITGDGEVCAIEPGCIDVTVTATDAACCTATVTVTVPVINAVCHDSEGNQKVQVCHKGQSICISPNAVPAHLAHGDYLGECDEAPGCEEAPLVHNASTEMNTAASKKESQIRTRSSFVIPSLDAFTALNHQKAAFNYVDIGPNPAKDFISLTVNRGLDGMTDIIVFNLNGQIVKTFKTEVSSGSTIELNISDLPNGNYSLLLTDQNGLRLNQTLLVNKGN